MSSISFAATSGAVFSVFFVGFIGFFASRRKILTPSGNSEIARVLVDFILPATLFNAMFSHYTFGSEVHLARAICAELSFFAVGSSTAYLLYRLLIRDGKAPGPVAALSALQNNLYLPLPIAMALLPPKYKGAGEFLIGCFVVCFTPLLWSVGIVLLGAKRAGGSVPRLLLNALNPPFVAAISGLVVKILFLRMGWTMPKLFMDMLRLIGSATTPMAMIVLGALLAEIKWSRMPGWRPVAIVCFVKLAFLPALALAVVLHWKTLPWEFGFIALLESSMPPATNISVAAKRFGIDTDLIALTLLVTYLISLFTVPMWMTFLPPPP